MIITRPMLTVTPNNHESGYTANYKRIGRFYSTYLRNDVQTDQTPNPNEVTFSHKSNEEDESSRRQEPMTNDDSTNFCSRSKTFRGQKEENL